MQNQERILGETTNTSDWKKMQRIHSNKTILYNQKNVWLLKFQGTDPQVVLIAIDPWKAVRISSAAVF